MTAFKSDVWLIFSRELKELLKDRKTIILTVVIPLVIYPLLMWGMTKLKGFEEEQFQEKVIRIFVTSKNSWLQEYLQVQKEKIVLMRGFENPQAGLRNGELDLWLEFLDEDQGDSGLIVINYCASFDDSNRARQAIADILTKGRGSYLERKITQLGHRYRVGEVLHTEFIDQSTDQAKSGYLAGKIVPFLMIIMILSGASFAAVDLVSGEKERGTLETLLLAPVSRNSIVWGKFFVVLIIAVVAAVVNLIGIAITLSFNLLDIPLLRGVHFSLGASELLVIFALLLPMAVFFSAILMIVASYADSFKEGQYYLLPLTFLSMAPAIVTLMPGIELNSIMMVVPIASLALATKEVLGGVYNWFGLGVAFLANSLYAIIAIRVASTILDRENVLSRSSSDRYDPNRQLAQQAAYLFAVAWLVLFFGAPVLQQANLIAGLWATELFLVALPALLFIRVHKLPFKSFVRFNRFSGVHFLGGLILEIAAMMTLVPLMELQNKLLPFPKSLSDMYTKTFTDTGYPLWLNIVTFAVSAGVCEELLFRGVLTRALIRKLSSSQTILVVGVMFGLFHFDIYRIGPTAFLGFIFTYICLKSGSLIPTMILHTMHNALMISIASLRLDEYQRFFLSVPGIIILIMLYVLGWTLLTIKKKENYHD